MNTPPRLGNVPRDLARKLLESYGSAAGVQSAVLFTPDGFEIASHATDATASARLAAIGSSLAALGEAISTEAGLNRFERTTIESRDGTVMIMRIDGKSPMSLVVVTGKDVILGQLLWATQRCCQALSKLMNG